MDWVKRFAACAPGGRVSMVPRLVALGALCITGLVLFISAGFSIGHSAVFNYSWTQQYLDTFGLDTLLPRHLPGAWAGLGAHDFFFYGPLPYWVTAALVSPVCAGCAVETGIVVTASLFWMLSAITCYMFLRRFYTAGAAVAGALGYALMPYHLVIDWFYRQALGEFAAYAFLPLIALGIDAVRCGTRGRYWLAIGVAGMTLCHLPTLLLAAHVVSVVVLVFATGELIRKRPIVKGLLEMTLWAVAGILVTAFYWLPALALIPHVASDLLYSEHYIATRWLVQFSHFQTSGRFGGLVWLTCLAVVPVILIAAFHARREVLFWILPPTLLVIFLNTELSAFIWDTWIIRMVQFPWRLMVFVDFAAALSIAALVSIPGLRRMSTLAASLALGFLPMIGVIHASAHRITTPFDTTGPTPVASEYMSVEFFDALDARMGGIDVNEFPHNDVYAETERIFKEVSAAQADRISVEVTHRQIRILPDASAGNILVPQQYWEFWQARLADGTPLAVTADKALGVLSVAAPDQGFGGQEVILSLPYHPSEKLGGLLSICAVLFWIMAVRFGRRRAHPLAA